MERLSVVEKGLTRINDKIATMSKRADIVSIVRMTTLYERLEVSGISINIKINENILVLIFITLKIDWR
jgi:hypothetical protein